MTRSIGRTIAVSITLAMALVWAPIDAATASPSNAPRTPPTSDASPIERAVGLRSLTPARLADTRIDGVTIDGQVRGVGAIAAQGVLVVPVVGRGGLPAGNVGAVMLNVTVVSASGPGYLTVFPCGAPVPLASNLNYVAGEILANAALARVGDGGAVCIYTLASADIVVDVNGWSNTGGATNAVNPARLADTRAGSPTVDGLLQGVGRQSAGSVLSVSVLGRASVPAAGVDSVVVNVTTVSPDLGGFLTVFPCGMTPPLAANANYVPGQIIANTAVVQVGAGGGVCVFTSAATDIVVDVTGWTRSDSVMTSIVPARLADTRRGAITVDGTGAGYGAPRQGIVDTLSVRVAGRAGIPQDTGVVSSVIVNVTAVSPGAPGYLTIYSCDRPRPLAANVNYVARQVIPNAALVEVGPSGTICVFSPATTDLVVDVTGWSSTPPNGAYGRATGLPAMTSDSLYRSSGYAASAQLATLYRAPTGGLRAAAVDTKTKTIVAVGYDPTTMIQTGARTLLGYDGWDRVGDLYGSPNGDLYVLLGRSNPAEDDDFDVVEVRRYDASFELLGSARIKGGATHGAKGIYNPFDATSPDMVLAGNRLVVHMARTIYRTPDNLRHQVNFSFEVNVDTMTATPFSALGGISYSSHSFRQLVAMSGSTLLVADHGDAYPRSIVVGVMANYPTSRVMTPYEVFPFNGAIGANFTGATLTGMVTGTAGALIVGNSVDHPNAPSGPIGKATDNRNIYLVTLDPSTGAHSLRWLTTYPASGGPGAGEPRIVPLSADRFAVVFPVLSGTSPTMEYRLVDSTGAVLAAKSFPGMSFGPSAEPVLIGNRIVWLGSRPNVGSSETWLYSLDVSDPHSPLLGR